LHLKSLTVKGFKSFANPTTLEFEPGVTCVVGPNGSGKSNVVDALSWVMGEQGAKSLRGGKMEDVIFAGTSGKSALGRAEVSLTIDNTDGALPIDYTEVTISRIMFRSGGSEYSINGSPCRLLDVQELLSDSGIGREMHVIVGQGQLDSILHATSEDRRGFVEEAAGVLKHRKRKEKALRKLGALDDKMSRLTDLLGELRRQLKPLGRQAEVARRAAVIQSDVRDAKLRLLADDLAQSRGRLQQDEADEAALRQRRSEVEAALLAEQAKEAELIAAAEQASPELVEVQQLWHRLSALSERFRATKSVAAERLRSIEESDAAPPTASDPDELEAEADRLGAHVEELAAEVRSLQERLTSAGAALAAAQQQLSQETQRVESALRDETRRKEDRARLQTRLESAVERVRTQTSDLETRRSALVSAQARAGQAQQAFLGLESKVTDLDTGEVDLDAEYETAVSEQQKLSAELGNLNDELSALRHRRAEQQARFEALSTGLAARRATPEEILAAPDVGESIAERISVTPGYERAVTAALGEFADALTVDSATAGIGHLHHAQSHGGSVHFAVSQPSGADEPSTAGPAWPALAQFVQVPAELAGTLAERLRGVVVAQADEAQRAVADGAAAVVTLDGSILTATEIRGGAMSADTTTVELAAQIEEAEGAVTRLGADIDRLTFDIRKVTSLKDQADRRVDTALSALHDSDARMSAISDELASHGRDVKSAQTEAARLEQEITAIEAGLEQDRADVERYERSLAEQGPATATEVSDRRDEYARQVEEARGHELEARLGVRTTEERLRVERARVEQLQQTAAAQRDATRRWREQKQRQQRQREVAAAVHAAAQLAHTSAQSAAESVNARRERGEAQRLGRDQELHGLRATIKELAGEYEQLTSSVHRDEMIRTELRVQVQQMVDRALEEFGLDPENLLGEYGPDVLVPPSTPAAGDAEEPVAEQDPYPYDRQEQERRLRSAQRAMSLLGRVNPLALEEFAAMEERHQFLSEQLEDIRKSRADLLGIVANVDERVEQVFAEAFADTAREFEGVFSRLFPGGEGRLVLTDPKDMLATGIEVEARPPGKKVKRLSLLSGGERSLTAVAFLVALFKARPSPFYVLDEVEAALDDVNLGRLLEVIEELRASSQLIVITHQKRTMEAADALYGVSMRGDGVSKVISQRMAVA